jgi:translocator protein
MAHTPDTLATWATLAGFLAATFIAGAAGSLFRPGAWYRGLRKPSWTPPDRLFPIAWTALYLAMAVAAWRVALSPARLAPAGIAFWSCQLLLNALWSPVVFGLRRLGTGVLVIGLLWIAVALTGWLFWQAVPLAGWLMLPYLIWVSYAGALNLAVWRMNPAAAPAR